MKVLIIDNYDSFVYNLHQYFMELGASSTVIRNDAIDLTGVRRMDPDAIVISPGPGKPSERRDFGISSDILSEISTEVPTLGVCLGHQGIAHVYGGTVKRGESPVHGKASPIVHDGSGLYKDLESPMTVGRYHSLVVDPDLPSCLQVTSKTVDGVVMGIRHRIYPIEGVQFHPESVLTPNGKSLLSNFLSGVRC